MSHSSRPFREKRMLIIIIIAGALAAGIWAFPFYGPTSWEVRRVQKALSLYFAEHDKYPRDIETLVKESLLKEGTFERVTYTPSIGYGNYSLSASGVLVRCAIVSGPMSFSETSQEEISKQLRQILREYYTAHGRYPKKLYDIPEEIAGVYLKEIRGREFEYSSHEDSQSFYLYGNSFGHPSTWPSEARLWNTEGKIQYLERELNLFLDFGGRYPESLEEMVGPRGMPASLLRDLTEGESIVYEVAQDGKTAYLNGERVRPFPWKHRQGQDSR